MTSLSEVAKQVDQEWNTVQRQYQAEEKRGGRCTYGLWTFFHFLFSQFLKILTHLSLF